MPMITCEYYVNPEVLYIRYYPYVNPEVLYILPLRDYTPT